MLDMIDWRQSGSAMNHLAFDYIATLMTRQEFDLIHILTPSHLIGTSTNNVPPLSSSSTKDTSNGSSGPMLSSAPILSPSASSASLLNIERPPPSHLSAFEHIRVFQHYRAVMGRTMLAVMELLQQCETELTHGTAHIRKMRVKIATNPDSVIPAQRSGTTRASSSVTHTPPAVATPIAVVAASKEEKDDNNDDDMEMLVVVPPGVIGPLAATIISGTNASSHHDDITPSPSRDTDHHTNGNDATNTSNTLSSSSSLTVIKEKKTISDAERTSFDQQLHMSQCMEPQLQTFVAKILAV